MPLPRLLFASLVLTVAALPAPADPPPATPAPAAMACCTPTPPAPEADSHWHVRAEVLAVVLPMEKAAAVMPELLDPSKSADGVEQIFHLLGERDATVAGYSVVSTVEGRSTKSETILEKIYPTAFSYPPGPGVPTKFEKRNVGLTLAFANPQVLDGGRTVDATYLVEDTHYLGTESFETPISDGPTSKIEQSRFFAARNAGQTLFDNGKWLLLGSHKLVESEDSIELFVARVTVTPRVP